MENGRKNYLISASILFSVIIIAGAWIYTTGLKTRPATEKNIPQVNNQLASLESQVLPKEGIVLPTKWDDLGKKLVESGVIDAQKLESIYTSRGGLSPEDKKLIYGAANGELKITEKNAGLILNLLWALGLGNKNEILEKGPMADPQYGGVQNFASTGGWTIGQGNVTTHYSRHQFITLTPAEQLLVLKVSKGIYRPCCDNSTYFPDCNHGMAMLGFLELMASQGANEEELYKAALAVNSYWFPDAYLTIAKYLEQKSIPWNKAVPEEVLGSDYSSASGYFKIASQVTPREGENGSGCNV